MASPQHTTTFQFGMKQIVKIEESDEAGTVIGRAEYESADNTYLIRYKTAEGVATEAWWTEKALVAF